MITYELDEEHAILTVHPEGPLAKEDFEYIAKVIDPFIEQKGKLAGLILDVARQDVVRPRCRTRSSYSSSMLVIR